MLHSLLKKSLPIVLALTASLAQAQVGPTDQVKLINGLIPAPYDVVKDWQRLYVATEFGLLIASPDGMSDLVQDLAYGITGMAINPANPNQILASGFGRESKIPALLRSRDAGNSWQVQDGEYPNFRALSFSAKVPDMVYGISKQLNISQDGGVTWKTTGSLPDRTFNLAASALSPKTLYAATIDGLLQSDDHGETWRKIYDQGGPVTMVNINPAGRMIAYVYGVGLIETQEADMQWQVLNTEFGDRYILNVLRDQNTPDRLYVTTESAAILLSRDGGKSWSSFEGSYRDSAENIAKGAALFAGTCQACHGVGAIGEDPGNPGAKDEFGFKAPALNNDEHAWHHSDNGIKATIRGGSPRNERMVPFKDIFSEAEIDNILSYIKSTWSLNSLACQGSRHMSCQ